MFNTNKKYKLTETVVISALLLASAIGINYFRFYIPIAGTQSVRVALNGPFLRFIGILFGPALGGIASASSDVITFIMNPTGPYIWPLTVTAFLNGFTTAFLWHTIKKVNFNIFRITYIALFSILAVLGILNLVFINIYPSSSYVTFFERRLDYISLGFIISGAVGLLIYFLAKRMFKGKHEIHLERFMKLIVSVGIPGLLLSTVNTFILIISFGWSTPFIIIWIPRIVEQMLQILFSVSVLVLFCATYERVFKKLD